MPREPTRDGGHTIFTNHRIARNPEVPVKGRSGPGLKPWREPAADYRQRNLGLALAEFGDSEETVGADGRSVPIAHPTEKTSRKILRSRLR